GIVTPRSRCGACYTAAALWLITLQSLDQRALPTALENCLADYPGLAARQHGGRASDVRDASVGQLNELPTDAIPMEGERVPRSAAIVEPSGPDVVRRRGGNPEHVAPSGLMVGARDHGPAGAIPVLDERSSAKSLHVLEADRPDVIGRQRHHALERRLATAGARAVDLGPTAPVVVGDESQKRVWPTALAHRPDVVAGKRSDPSSLAHAPPP